MNKNPTKNLLERFSCSIVGRGKKASGYKILLESLFDLRQSSNLFVLDKDEDKENLENEAVKPSSLLSLSSFSKSLILHSDGNTLSSPAEKIKETRKNVFTNFRFKSVKKISVVKPSTNLTTENAVFYKKFKIIETKMA